jgi:hypothetical protein
MRRPEVSGRGIADANLQIHQEGRAGRDAGGLWGRHQARAKETAGAEVPGAGALSEQVDMSHAFADEASAGDMNISTETAAQIVGRQNDAGGAPLPPEPLVAPGIHADGMQRPYVPFSPPPARVTSPLASSPKMTIQGSDTGDLDTLAAGEHLAHALQTPMGGAQVGVQTLGDVGRSTRLDLLTDREQRSENRLYNV